MTAAPKPMLASKADAIPTVSPWIMEPKYDGWRCLAHVTGRSPADLHSRTGASITQVPYIGELLTALPVGTILDGELVNLTTGEQFKRTQSICKKQAVHKPSATNPPLVYRVFDVLEVEGNDLKLKPLSERKQYLNLLMRMIDPDDMAELSSWAGFTVIETVEPIACEDPKADDWFNDLMAEGYEGVVCKNAGSVYAPGARNANWLKIKPEQEMDVEVTGVYEPTKGSRLDGIAVGGITFKATHEDGSIYQGRCAGMDDELRQALYADPQSYVGKVAEVAFASVEESGALRFPRLKRLRDPADKAVAELDPENPGRNDKSFLLTRAIEAEERADVAEAEVARLKLRISALLAQLGLDSPIDPQAPEPTPMHVPTSIPEAHVHAGARAKARHLGGVKKRNYNAMGVPKLSDALRDFERGRGPAVEEAESREAEGIETVAESEQRCRLAAKRKGLI